MTSKTASAVSWWQGRRGEWYVLGQVGLFLLVMFGPRTMPGLQTWPGAIGSLASGVGTVLVAAGLLWVVAGAARLGANLTALPHPKDSGRLIHSGAYALVRHPMYCGAIWVSVGMALQTQGILTLGYAILLAVFLDVKASREERWLCAKYPDYASYRRRVRKLIPFVY
jgi:protein-S-isoprenylcysteine O-methyltransferase Ste14